MQVGEQGNPIACSDQFPSAGIATKGGLTCKATRIRVPSLAMVFLKVSSLINAGRADENHAT